MSSSALRQAAFNARRVYTIGDQAEGQRPTGGSDKRLDAAAHEVTEPVALESHWEASIDSATD